MVPCCGAKIRSSYTNWPGAAYLVATRKHQTGNLKQHNLYHFCLIATPSSVSLDRKDVVCVKSTATTEFLPIPKRDEE